ncbi:hypothetical protein BDZ89DRAFT_1124394 [Hymenopellis radicata]|nr:hypothetical protein BDZ89DRAFT_1124394 [Hymenopellis radicata]
MALSFIGTSSPYLPPLLTPKLTAVPGVLDGYRSPTPPNEFIPPVAEPYEYIIFRASEVKDLAVDEAATAAPAPQVRRSVHDDPAVVGAGPQPQPRQRRADSVHTAMESVERAIGEIQQQQQQGNGGGNKFKVPTTDFDFSASNARFTKPEGKGEGVEEVEAYNPQKSFFDTLTPRQAPHTTRTLGGDGGGDGGGGRKSAIAMWRRLGSQEVWGSWGLALMWGAGEGGAAALVDGEEVGVFRLGRLFQVTRDHTNNIKKCPV